MSFRPRLERLASSASPDGGGESLGGAIHTWKFDPGLWALTRLAVFSIGMFAFLGAAIGLTRDWSAVADNWTYLAIASAVVPAFWCVFAGFGGQTIHLELRAGGLAFSGAHSGTIPWAAVTALHVEPGGEDLEQVGPLAQRRIYPWQCIVVTPTWRLTIGSSGLPGPRIAEIVSEQTLPLIWQRLRVSLSNGHDCSLGAVVVTPDGIRAGRELIRWKQLASIEVQGRHIVIEGKIPILDGHLKVLRQLVNFEDVLLRLADVTFAYRFDLASELVLPEIPPAPPPAATIAPLPVAEVVAPSGRREVVAGDATLGVDRSAGGPEP